MGVIKTLYYKIITPLKKWQLNKELKAAIHLAKEARYKTHKKQMVLFYQGRFQVFERTTLKRLVTEGNTFKKGTTIKHLEKMAMFITD